MTLEEVSTDMIREMENYPKTHLIFTEYRDGEIHQGLGIDKYIEKCREYYKQVAEKYNSTKKAKRKAKYDEVCNEIHRLHESMHALQMQYSLQGVMYNSKLGLSMRTKIREKRNRIKELNIIKNKLFFKIWKRQ